ncbi:MAG TPA: hypothetical protein VN426_05370 [Syntrophomonadaceae bacterium]|nr:hypothetical protein [Syntrophomonadaceae bacterium]
MNNSQSYAREGNRRALPDQEDARRDSAILQVYKYPAATTPGRPIGISWFEWALIIIATVLFIMTVTAQLCIYFRHL